MRRDFAYIRVGVYASTLSIRLGEQVVKKLQRVNRDKYIELVRIKPVTRKKGEEFELLVNALQGDKIDMAAIFLDKLYQCENDKIERILKKRGLSLATVMPRESEETVLVKKRFQSQKEDKLSICTDSSERLIQIEDRFPESSTEVFEGVNSCLRELSRGNVSCAILPMYAIKVMSKDKYRGFEYLNYDRKRFIPSMGQGIPLLIERDGEGLELSSKRLLDGDTAYEVFMEREIYDKIKELDKENRLDYLTINAKASLNKLDINVFLDIEGCAFRINKKGDKLDKNVITSKILEEVNDMLIGL